MRSASNGDIEKVIKENDKSSRFLCFQCMKKDTRNDWSPVDGKYIHVEVTALQFIDTVTKFAVDRQAIMFSKLMEDLPNPGDAQIVVNDVVERGHDAFVTRLKNAPDGTIRFLIGR